MATSGTDDQLMIATQNLAASVSDYKQAAKTVKGMCAKPKAAKAKSKP